MDADIDQELRLIAAKVSEGKRRTTTPRELLESFGAKRRGANVVEQIRAHLSRHQLETKPDFNDVHVDEKIRYVTSLTRPVYHDKLEAADGRLRDEQDPTEVPVRTFLGWFGASKRGSKVVDRVAAALDSFDLRTEPDFNSVSIDSSVKLVRASAERPKQDTQPCEPVDVDEPTQDRSEPRGLLVGSLPEARREVRSVKPQTTIQQAVTVMLTNSISYLPIFHSERTVKGIIRWVDVAKHFALAGGSASDPVEKVARAAEIVPSTAPFLKVISKIIEHGCILVRGEDSAISGIITNKDLGRQLENLAHPFFILGEIERTLRSIIERGLFTAVDLRERALDPSDDRPVETVADLTLGECARLLQDTDSWERVKVRLDRKLFVARLHEVRQIRNEVMHFGPDDDPEQHRKTLEDFWELLTDIDRVSG